MARYIRDEKSRRRNRRARSAEAKGRRRDREEDRQAMLTRARALENEADYDDAAGDSYGGLPETLRKQASHLFRRAGTL